MILRKPEGIEFDELTHSYYLGDTLLTGITTLMANQGLSADYSDIPEDVLQDAAKRGTSVHNLFEAYDNGEPAIPMDVYSDFDENRKIQTKEEQKELLDAYKKLGLKVIQSEFLVSDGVSVASFIDKVLETDEENTVDLGDVKTSADFHREPTAWQLSFYAYLFELLNPGIRVRKLIGIHARNGKVKNIELQRKPVEDCIGYIEAEKNGTIYIPESTGFTADMVLSSEDLAVFTKMEEAARVYNDLLARMKEKMDAINQKLYDFMLSNDIDELPIEGGVVKLKRPFISERFDTAKFKKEHPDMVKQYIKASTTKGSISFKHTISNE